MELHERAAHALYLERNGAALDAAIARCERILAISDAEVARVGAEPPSNYRWLIGPSVVLRWQTLHLKLLAQKEELQQQCFEHAAQIAQRWGEEALWQEAAAREKNAPGEDSLCLPKQTKAAPEADPRAIPPRPAAPPAQGAGA